ncbi:hypothetical protein, partial [Hungatella sp. SL.1.14]|uniref:hypothetical protein n=1 Tax=Hungatella sp. SL.1.14 TaxID=2963703 RepID=UPI00210CCBA5
RKTSRNGTIRLRSIQRGRLKDAKKAEKSHQKLCAHQNHQLPDCERFPIIYLKQDCNHRYED